MIPVGCSTHKKQDQAKNAFRMISAGGANFMLRFLKRYRVNPNDGLANDYFRFIVPFQELLPEK
jgi:hypothetical protein